MSQYTLQKSDDIGYWVATDTIRNIVIKFKEKQFNDTQEVMYLENIDNPDALSLAKASREIGDWLFENHLKIL